MPILDVTALPQPDNVNLGTVEAALIQAVAAELDEEPSGTWIVWRALESGRYAENGDAPALQPASTHPPLVRVIAYEGRSPEIVARVLVAVAETLVRELGLASENAFVMWDELQAGRVYTGGRVLGA